MTEFQKFMKAYKESKTTQRLGQYFVNEVLHHEPSERLVDGVDIFYSQDYPATREYIKKYFEDLQV